MTKGLTSSKKHTLHITRQIRIFYKVIIYSGDNIILLSSQHMQNASINSLSSSSAKKQSSLDSKCIIRRIVCSKNSQTILIQWPQSHSSRCIIIISSDLFGARLGDTVQDKRFGNIYYISKKHISTKLISMINKMQC